MLARSQRISSYPHLSYVIILWGSTYNCHINKLVVLQKKLVRILTNAGFNEHTLELFAKTKVLRLNDIYKLEIAKFMHKYCNGELPEPLSNIFKYTFNVHEYYTRQFLAVRPFACRLTITKNSILYKGPYIWNNLPTDLQNEHRRKPFIKVLKGKIYCEYTSGDEAI